MTSSRPYLLRALYEWILDNSMSPYLLVNAAAKDVSVPENHIRDGQIVLNIHPDAVNDFVMNNEVISFSARFGGKVQQIYVPIKTVTAIYAKETGKGLVFPDDPDDQQGTNDGESGKSTKPFLKVIK